MLGCIKYDDVRLKSKVNIVCCLYYNTDHPVYLLQSMILPGYQTSDSASSSKFHHLALLVALVSCSSNFHHWPLLALLVALVLY